MMALLESLKASLATIPGIISCQIGLEDGISPDQYPLIRIVPVGVKRLDLARRRVDTLIYFGMPIQAFDDVPDGSARIRLEKVYAALFVTEGLILEKLVAFQSKYDETITDEDRLDTYKLMAIRCQLDG